MKKMDIKNFKDWQLNENSQDEQLNEFLGLGKLLKAFFKSLSEPVRKKVEIISKNIDDKTGKIKDSKTLMNDLLGTFKTIADDKKADLKGVDDVDTFKDIMKEFMTEIKAVFSAARIPFSAIAESEIEEFDEFVDIITEEELNEKKSRKQRKEEKAAQTGQKPAAPKPTNKNVTLAEVMTKTSPEEFDSQVDSFLDTWIEKNGGNKDVKKLETEGTKLIDTMMKKFETKIKEFGPERIQKLIKLATKNPEPKKEEIKQALEEKPEDKLEGTPVETDAGKQQIMKAVEKALKDGNEMLKIKDGDAWNIVIKGVQF